jgi:hypothetical protein
MKKWLRRIRGAVGMGLTWAAGWTLVGMLGVVVFYTLFPNVPDVADVWIPVFAYPGFFGGAVFSVVLGIGGRRRRFDEMSLPRFAGWGALGGLLVMLPFMVGLGFSSVSLVVASIMTLLCSGSAAGSLALARRAEDRELLGASADVAEVGLTEDEGRDLLGDGG